MGEFPRDVLRGLSIQSMGNLLDCIPVAVDCRSNDVLSDLLERFARTNLLFRVLVLRERASKCAFPILRLTRVLVASWSCHCFNRKVMNILEGVTFSSP